MTDYILRIPQNKIIDDIIEDHLSRHPDSSVDDALEDIFNKGVTAQLAVKLERAILARRKKEHA